MTKLRYETDPHNRLIVAKTGAKGRLAGFRRVLDGTFKTGKDNSLLYHVKQPLDSDAPCGTQIKLSGKWGLDKNHDLVYTLNAWQDQVSGDELTLRCQIIDATDNSLTAALITRSSKGSTSVYMLSLEGSWQADAKNRLTFRLNSSARHPDTLTFDGIWELGKHHELMYRYEKEKLSRGKRTTHTLSFKGHWDIGEKTRLGYVLDGSAVKKPAFTFTGSWKLTPSSGLTFEMREQQGRLCSISLSVKAKLSKKATIICTLKNNLNRSSGAEIELSQEVLKGDGQAFLRLLASKGEQGVFIGMGRSW